MVLNFTTYFCTQLVKSVMVDVVSSTGSPVFMVSLQDCCQVGNGSALWNFSSIIGTRCRYYGVGSFCIDATSGAVRTQLPSQ